MVDKLEKKLKFYPVISSVLVFLVFLIYTVITMSLLSISGGFLSLKKMVVGIIMEGVFISVAQLVVSFVFSLKGIKILRKTDIKEEFLKFIWNIPWKVFIIMLGLIIASVFIMVAFIFRKYFVTKFLEIFLTYGILVIAAYYVNVFYFISIKKEIKKQAPQLVSSLIRKNALWENGIIHFVLFLLFLVISFVSFTHTYFDGISNKRVFDYQQIFMENLENPYAPIRKEFLFKVVVKDKDTLYMPNTLENKKLFEKVRNVKLNKNLGYFKMGIDQYKVIRLKSYSGEDIWLFVNLTAERLGSGFYAGLIPMINLLVILFIYLIPLILVRKSFESFYERIEKSGDVLFLEYTGVKEVNRIISIIEDLLGKAYISAENLRKLVEKVTEHAQDIAANIEELTATFEELSANSENIAKGAEMQSQLVDNAKDRLNEVKEFGEKVIENANIVQNNAQNSMKLIEEFSTTSINSVISQAQDTEHSVMEVSKEIENLRHKTLKIGELVEGIKEVTRQTWLIALNAQIEAARSGMREISIIAEEIRNLSDRASDSTNYIVQFLNEIEEAVSRLDEANKNVVKNAEMSVKEAENIKTNFEDIISSFKEVEKSVKDTVESIKMQFDKIKDLIKEMEELAGIASNTAANTEEISASIETATSSMETIAANVQTLVELTQKYSQSENKK